MTRTRALTLTLALIAAYAGASHATGHIARRAGLIP